MRSSALSAFLQTAKPMSPRMPPTLAPKATSSYGSALPVFLSLHSIFVMIFALVGLLFCVVEFPSIDCIFVLDWVCLCASVEVPSAEAGPLLLCRRRHLRARSEEGQRRACRSSPGFQILREVEEWRGEAGVAFA